MKRTIIVLGLVGVGCAGADGADGANGVDGKDAVLEVREATEDECSDGGYVLITSEKEVVICDGADGETGATGPQGELGPAGPRGPQGAVGATGASGQTRAVGPQGASGAPGEVGDTGAQGPQGQAGPKGDAGDVGAQGVKGDTGDVGPAGTPGDDGAFSEGLVSATLYCGAALENTIGLSFAYWARIFADGSVWAAADIISPSISASGSRIYAPTQVGASNAGVNLVMDQAPPANGGWWDVNVDRQTLVVNIVYHDADVTDGQMSWTLDSNVNNCVLNEDI